MEKIVCIIILSVMGALFVFSLIWYFIKLRCLKYSGKTDGTVTKIEEREYTDQETKEKKIARYITAEYEAEGMICKATANLWDIECSEGDRLRIFYDEANPRRYVFEQEISDPKEAKKRWIIMPALAFFAGIFAFVIMIPQIFGFSRQQKGTFDIIIDILLILFFSIMGVMELQKQYRSGKLTRKKLINFVITSILAVMIAAIFFIIIFVKK